MKKKASIIPQIKKADKVTPELHHAAPQPKTQQKSENEPRKGQSIFLQMHTNNLIQLLEVVVLDWSATRQPDDYICLEFTLPKDVAEVPLKRLEISKADHWVTHKGDLVQITLKNVVSMWADTLRFWR